jgi:hypothetical protein
MAFQPMSSFFNQYINYLKRDRILEELGLVAAECNTRLHPFEAVAMARAVAVNYKQAGFPLLIANRAYCGPNGWFMAWNNYWYPAF